MSQTLVCKRCSGMANRDECVVVDDEVFHDGCLTCFDCNFKLTEKCYFKHEQFYCKTDYFKRFGPKCSGCDVPILPDEKIRKAKRMFYHLSCYKCSECQQRFLSGDILHLVDEEKLLCNEDYYKLYGSSKSMGTKKRPFKPSTKEPRLSKFGTNTDELEVISNLCQPEDLEQDDLLQRDVTDMDCAEEDVSNNSSDAKDGYRALPVNNGKRRGPRTTIKPKQLEMLKIAFISTPKPTRHMREKLAEETGLGMRVIQVWFQNRRSKERRIKQISTHRGNRDHLFGESVSSTSKFGSLQHCDDLYTRTYDGILFADRARIGYDCNNLGYYADETDHNFFQNEVYSPDSKMEGRNYLEDMVQWESLGYESWNGKEQQNSKIISGNWEGANYYLNGNYETTLSSTKSYTSFGQHSEKNGCR